MENDPIGLAIGTLNKPVSKVLVTLDVNEAVAEEAIAKGCELIIAHHPPILDDFQIFVRTIQLGVYMKSL